MKKLMGLGYRAPFHDFLIEGHPEIGWVEVITENYLWDKGQRRQTLETLRSKYEVALHGVSLSLASPEDLDVRYLKELKSFADELQPVRVSDHLCWSSLGGHHWHDLLPFPYTEENLERIIKKVHLWQDILKRPLVLENLSAYALSNLSTMSECAFLSELSKRTSCQILLDVNNMVVNARNFGIDPFSELLNFSMDSIAQVHLAGFIEGKEFVIDTHSEPPHPATWELWRDVCARRSDIPFMIEWDSNIPAFEEVLGHLGTAERIRKEAKWEIGSTSLSQCFQTEK